MVSNQGGDLFLQTKAPSRNQMEEDEAATFKNVLEEYYKEQPTDRYYGRPTRVTYAWRCWQELIEYGSSEGQPVPTHLLEEVVKLLASSLFTTYSAGPLFPDHGSFFRFSLDIQSLFNNPYMPSQMPVILYIGSRFNENDATELRDLMEKITPNSRLALILLFVESKNIEEALDLSKTILQGAYSLDIVPMIDEEFLKIIDAADAIKVFSQLVFSNVDLSLKSPFSYDGPAHGSMFFGREYELHLITEHAAINSYALIGGRRIGKTSILQRLRDVRLPAANFHVLFHDCASTPSQAELLQAVALDRSWFPHPPAHAFTSFAHVVHTLSSDKPLVILFDEADKLIQPDRSAGYPLFNTLRALNNAGHCRFVFSGERSFRDEIRNPDSPLYNFAKELLIGCLDFPSVRELVTQTMKRLAIEVINEGSVVQRIWDFTSGHPEVVKRLCSRLIGRLKRGSVLRLTMTDVGAVIMNPDFLLNDFLNTYWQRATPLERLCSLVMAADDSTCTLSTVQEALIHHNLVSTLEQVNNALERLVDLRNILRHTSDGYEFAVSAFPGIISNTNSLSMW